MDVSDILEALHNSGRWGLRKIECHHPMLVERFGTNAYVGPRRIVLSAKNNTLVAGYAPDIIPVGVLYATTWLRWVDEWCRITDTPSPEGFVFSVPHDDVPQFFVGMWDALAHIVPTNGAYDAAAMYGYRHLMESHLFIPHLEHPYSSRPELHFSCIFGDILCEGSKTFPPIGGKIEYLSFPDAPEFLLPDEIDAIKSHPHAYISPGEGVVVSNMLSDDYTYTGKNTSHLLRIMLSLRSRMYNRNPYSLIVRPRRQSSMTRWEEYAIPTTLGYKLAWDRPNFSSRFANSRLTPYEEASWGLRGNATIGRIGETAANFFQRKDTTAYDAFLYSHKRRDSFVVPY